MNSLATIEEHKDMSVPEDVKRRRRLAAEGGWIGVDLDGTLAKYDGWVNETHIGEPIAPMIERVKAWLADGIEVRVFTARVGPTNDSFRTLDTIQDWTEKHIGQRLPVTCIKDFNMIELWDDRCVQVVANTGEPVAPETLNQQLTQLLEGATAEKMLVAGVVADLRNVEHMKLFSSIGEEQAVHLFAAVVKAYAEGPILLRDPAKEEKGRT